MFSRQADKVVLLFFSNSNLRLDSTGGRYNELIHCSIFNSRGGGFRDSALVSRRRSINHLLETFGNYTKTITHSRNSSESKLRDFRTSDRVVGLALTSGKASRSVSRACNQTHRRQKTKQRLQERLPSLAINCSKMF